MADKAPQVVVPKAKLYKMVSWKGTTSSNAEKMTPLMAAKSLSEMNVGMKSVISSINSLGASVNSIALQMQSLNGAVKESITSQVANANNSEALVKTEKVEEKKLKKKGDKEEKDRRKKEDRDEREKDAEKIEPKKKGKVFQDIKENVKKSVGGFFGAIARFAAFIFGKMVFFAVLDWISKNPDKVQKLAEALFALGKFVYRVTSFLVGSALDGLVKFMENPLSLQGFFGALQFAVSLAPIFLGMAFLKNPIGTARAVGWVVSSLVKGLLNLKVAAGFGQKMRKFAGTKLGKLAFAGGAGAVSFMAAKAGGADNIEATGAAIGGGTGYAVGAALGEATGIPGAGALAGAAGAFVGSKAGQAVGGFMKPIFEPIGRFFNMIGDMFKAVMAPIKDTLGGFFEALGAVMNGILDAIEPAMPIIKKVLGIGIQVAFWPFFLGLKALTAVLRFFAPKAEEKTQEVEKKMRGGPVKQTRAAGGPVVPVASPTPVVVPQTPKLAAGGRLNSMVMESAKEVLKLGMAFRELMLMPFKAVGIGIISAIGFIGNVFGSFLPAPLRSILGSLIAPIASLFGIPMSVLGGNTKAGTSPESKEGDEETKIEDKGQTWEEKLLEVIFGDRGTAKHVGELIKMLANHPALKIAKNVASGVLGFLGFAEGGVVTPQAVPGAASGGWISGPQSGYPVSLDGGQSVSFIGHGTEWVGMKGFSQGGKAFVIPFDTPATRSNGGLTMKRMAEAKSGGYAMPYMYGGALTPTLPMFAEGGKFNPDEYKAETDKTTSGLVLNDKTYYVRYNPAEDGKVQVKQVTKRVEAGVFGLGEKLTAVRPGSDEFKSILESEGLKEEIKKQNKRKSGTGRAAKTIPYNLQSITVHPKAEISYRYDQSYQQNKAAWMEKGVSEQQAEKLAARAAMELAMPSKDGKATTTATTRGEENLIVNAEGQTADELKPPKPAAEEKEEKEKKKGKSLDDIIKAAMEGFETAIKTAFDKGDPTLAEAEVAADAKDITPTTEAQSGSALETAQQEKQKVIESKMVDMQALQQAGAERTAAVAAANQQSAGMTGAQGGGQEEVPIILPGPKGKDSDPFIVPRFGIINEMLQDVSTLM